MGTLGLTAVQGRIDAACRRAGRDASDVRLVAVSKAASDEAILDAYRAGHRDFGENRADALAERIAKEHFDRAGGESAPEGEGPKRLRVLR